MKTKLKLVTFRFKTRDVVHWSISKMDASNTAEPSVVKSTQNCRNAAKITVLSL